MSWRDDMIAMGAKRRTPLGAAKRRKTTDQVVASTNSSGSTSAFDPKEAADNARETLWHAGEQKDAQQKALEARIKQIEAEAAQEAMQECSKSDGGAVG